MGNCGGKPLPKETIDESQKAHQEIPKALISSGARKSVRHVDLSGNSITTIDSKFWLNENIVEINISKNSTFTAIPAELAKLSKLERLDLSQTGITEIPDFVWTMQSLKILNVSGTKVTNLGLLAGNNIASLDISGLGLKELPETISAFGNLQVLKAADNKLATLPENISKCSKLKELHLEGNPLTHLPLAENLQKLEVLKIVKDQKEKAAVMQEGLFKEKKCLTCGYFKSGAAPVAPKRSESLQKKNEEAELNVTIVTASTEVKAAPRLMEPPRIVIDEFEETTKSVEEDTPDKPVEEDNDQNANEEKKQEEKQKIDANTDADAVDDNQSEGKGSRKSSSSSSSSSTSSSSKSCCACNTDADIIDKDATTQDEAQPEAALTDETAVPSIIKEEEKEETMDSPPEDREEPATITLTDEKTDETVPESAKPEIAPKPKCVKFSVSEYPGEVDHVVEKTEVSESQEDEEGVRITTVTTTVTTVVNGDAEGDTQESDNNSLEKAEKQESTSAKEKSPEPSRPAQSSEDCFKSEILRSRGVGSVRRSMMMFMEEQEKAAASKSSAARSVKKMPAFVDYQTDQPSLTGTGVVRVAVPIPQNFVETKIERKPIKTGRIEQIYDDAPEPEPTLKFLPNKPSMDLVSSTPKPAEAHKARIKIAASEEARAIVASAATRNASIENEDEIFVEKNFDNQVEVKTAQNVETKTIEVENGILTTEVTTTKTTVSSSRQITYSHQETIDYDDREVTRNETVISNSSSENTKVEADNLDMSFGDIKIEPEHLRPPSPAQEKVEESKIELSILDILKQTHFDEEPQEIVITAKRDRGASLGLSITSPLDEPAVDVPLAADTVIIKDIVVSSSASFNQSPKIGDVLVSIDGIEINSSNIESELQNCGNLITLKFKRFPSAFSGYN